MKKEKAQKLFPLYMRHISLPDGAASEEAEVFRICKTGKVEKDSFLPTYEEYKMDDRIEELDLSNPGSYSLSVWEKKRDARRMHTFFSKKIPAVIVAKGITATECGMIQRTREREGKNKKSHIDWWLYEDSEPHKYFEEVNIYDA